VFCQVERENIKFLTANYILWLAVSLYSGIQNSEKERYLDNINKDCSAIMNYYSHIANKNLERK